MGLYCTVGELFNIIVNKYFILFDENSFGASVAQQKSYRDQNCSCKMVKLSSANSIQSFWLCCLELLSDFAHSRDLDKCLYYVLYVSNQR